jgi:hypothetical protein
LLRADARRTRNHRVVPFGEAQEQPPVQPLVVWRGRDLDGLIAAYADVVELLWRRLTATRAWVELEFVVDDEDLDAPLTQRGFQISRPRRRRLGPMTFSSGVLRAVHEATEAPAVAAVLRDLPDWPSSVLSTLEASGSRYQLDLDRGLEYITLGGATTAALQRAVAHIKPELTTIAERRELRLETSA